MCALLALKIKEKKPFVWCLFRLPEKMFVHWKHVAVCLYPLYPYLKGKKLGTVGRVPKMYTNTYQHIPPIPGLSNGCKKGNILG